MLELKNIYKTFNPGSINEKRALNGINLTLEDGDFVTIIGGNGAGKSTMLNAIAGVWPVDSGSVIIDGEDITKLLDANENLSVTKAAVFCAMDYLDEYRKSTGSAENMRSQIQDYIADAARAKLAEDKAKAENEVLRREAAALREQLEKMRSKEARREERAQQAAQQTAGRSEDAEQKG